MPGISEAIIVLPTSQVSTESPFLGAVPGHSQWLHAEEEAGARRDAELPAGVWTDVSPSPVAEPGAHSTDSQGQRLILSPIGSWGVELRVTSAVAEGGAQHDRCDLSRSCKRPRESRKVGTTEQCLASTSSGGGWLRAPQSSSEFPRRKEETRSRQCLGHTPGTLV